MASVYTLPNPPPLRNALSSSNISTTTAAPSTSSYATTQPPPPRPSPSKRAYSSPSPNSSPAFKQDEPEESPRVSRARFTKEVSKDGEERPAYSPAPATITSPVVAELVGIPDTPPSPMGDRLVGLGVGLDAPVGSAKGGVSLPEHSHLTTPEDQTRTLMEMAPELSSVLNRLCSQHHMSEYNTLKRVVAAQANQAGQVQAMSAFSHIVPPPSSASLQRSHSTPPVPTSPSTTHSAGVNTRPAVTRSKTSATAATTQSLRPPPLNLSGAQSVPPLSRVSTPPPTLASRSESIQSANSTSLTPVLANTGFGRKKDSQATPPPAPKNIAEALTEALESSLPGAGAVASLPAVVQEPQFSTVPPIPPTPNGLLPGMEMMNGVAVKTSASHPMNISAMLPPEYLSMISSHFFSVQTSPKPKSPLMPSSSLSVNASPTLSANGFPHPSPFVISTPSACDLWNLTNHPIPAQSRPPTRDPSAKLLGNFLLSSCPGKKVRLGVQAVKGGRSAICRDVKMDLQRAKDEGVKLVICCLDDQELGYLGAPWDEYARAISSLNLEVIRIPMVEGYAPPSCALLDSHLERIIKNQTLRGESVLAHCRGGIGRAGLVACCWAIKCGFVSARGEDEEEGLGEAMKVVEQVIEVIRRRRSVKAIETALQVNFLLQYVTYLKDARTTIITSATEL